MSVATKCGLSLTALGAIVLTARLIPACSGGEQGGPQLVDSGTPVVADGGLYAGEAGAPCVAPPGEVPNPQCDEGTESLCATSTTCPISETPLLEHSSPTAAEAPPRASRSRTTRATTQNFRMRRIVLAAPPALVNPTIQNTVITNGVDICERKAVWQHADGSGPAPSVGS